MCATVPFLATHSTSDLILNHNNSQEDNGNIIGPKDGFSPQIGTLASMLDWMRGVVLQSVSGLSRYDLDYLHDDKANTIGAMLMHLCAVERYYQENTFKDFIHDPSIKVDNGTWSAATNLGRSARTRIKGHSLDFYLTILNKTRASTISELSSCNDQWLMYVDKRFGWGPTNNYCKWFHVCEHESNHNGQIKFIKNRLN